MISTFIIKKIITIDFEYFKLPLLFIKYYKEHPTLINRPCRKRLSVAGCFFICRRTETYNCMSYEIPFNFGKAVAIFTFGLGKNVLLHCIRRGNLNVYRTTKNTLQNLQCVFFQVYMTRTGFEPVLPP